MRPAVTTAISARSRQKACGTNEVSEKRPSEPRKLVKSCVAHNPGGAAGSAAE
jgi:hypothetical protein